MSGTASGWRKPAACSGPPSCPGSSAQVKGCSPNRPLLRWMWPDSAGAQTKLAKASRTGLFTAVKPSSWTTSQPAARAHSTKFCT